MKGKYSTDSFIIPGNPDRVKEKVSSNPNDSNKKIRMTKKVLSVVACPQGGGHVPSIRVAGKWLENYGFKLGDKVTIAAINNLIVIKKGEL